MLVSLDVVNLYTDILKYNVIIEVMVFWFGKTKERCLMTYQQNFHNWNTVIYPTREIYLVLYYLLSIKIWNCNGKRSCPSGFNLLMGYLDLEIHQTSLQKYCTSFHRHLKEKRNMYLGDYFNLWNENMAKLFDFKITL